MDATIQQLPKLVPWAFATLLYNLIGLIRALRMHARSSLLQLAAFPRGGLTPAETPLIDAEILFRQRSHLNGLPLLTINWDRGRPGSCAMAPRCRAHHRRAGACCAAKNPVLSEIEKLIPDNHVICQTGKAHAFIRAAYAFLIGGHGECSLRRSSQCRLWAAENN